PGLPAASAGGVCGVNLFYHPMPHGAPPASARRAWGRRGSFFMGNRNLLRQYDLAEDELQQQLEEAFNQPETGNDVESWLPPAEQEFETNKIVKGRVINIVGDDVLVDVGYKSEGIIPVNEWYDESQDKVVPPQPGDEIQVLLDAVEDESGAIVLSYRKA